MILYVKQRVRLAKMDKLGKGREIASFLKTFEGAAATFSQEDSMWSLWLPEVTAGERPITPASQLYFAVILRHDQKAFAIRFFYDCSTGKIRYYTSAVPQEIASAPEFENAVSELFRHTLPVEPIRQRKLRRLPGRRSRRNLENEVSPSLPKRQIPTEMAEPIEIELPPPSRLDASEPVAEIKPAEKDPALVEPEPVITAKVPVSVSVPVAEPPKARSSAPVRMVARVERPRSEPAEPSSPGPARRQEAERNDQRALAVTAPRQIEVTPRQIAPAEDERREASADVQAVRKVQFDVGERMRSVLMAIIVVCGIVSGLGIVAYTYMVMNEDPGVKHHRLQNELDGSPSAVGKRPCRRQRFLN